MKHRQAPIQELASGSLGSHVAILVKLHQTIHEFASEKWNGHFRGK
jgi:hypothetical protein